MGKKRKVYKTVKQVADELAEDWAKPLDVPNVVTGRTLHYKGEMFYSTLYRIAKAEKVDAQGLFEAMRRRGFWVHS